MAGRSTLCETGQTGVTKALVDMCHV